MAPTIVLVPGAWHRPSHYEPLLSKLRAAGFSTRSLQLPSVDAANATETTCANDAEYIRANALLPEVDAGNDVILIVHSYGGVPGGAAIKGLGRSAREGKSAVLGIIYMTAAPGMTGQSFLNGSELAPWASLVKETGLVTVPDPIPIMYSSVDDQALVAESAKNMAKGHSFTAFNTPSPEQGYMDADFEGRRVYLKCLKDLVFPAALQQIWIEGSKIAWNVEELEAGHSPQLSHSEEIAKIVAKYSKEWA